MCEQSLLHAIHDQSEQMLSIKAERNNYRKVIVVEETRGGRLFIGLMKIDSAMKEVQKGINRATKKKTKMLQRQAKILVKLKKVEENIERIQGEIEVMQEEIKVCFDRPHLISLVLDLVFCKTHVLRHVHMECPNSCHFLIRGSLCIFITLC